MQGIYSYTPETRTVFVGYVMLRVILCLWYVVQVMLFPVKKLCHFTLLLLSLLLLPIPVAARSKA